MKKLSICSTLLASTAALMSMTASASTDGNYVPPGQPFCAYVNPFTNQFTCASRGAEIQNSFGQTVACDPQYAFLQSSVAVPYCTEPVPL